jgi:hypothetical protein
VFYFWGELKKNNLGRIFKNSIGPKNKICLAILFYFILSLDNENNWGFVFQNKK